MKGVKIAPAATKPAPAPKETAPSRAWP